MEKMDYPTFLGEKSRISRTIGAMLLQRGYRWDEINAEITDVFTNKTFRCPSIDFENLYDRTGLKYVNTRIVVGDYRVGHKNGYYKILSETGDYNFNGIVDSMIAKARS